MWFVGGVVVSTACQRFRWSHLFASKELRSSRCTRRWGCGMPRDAFFERALAIVEATVRLSEQARRRIARVNRAHQNARRVRDWGAEVRSAIATTRVEAQHIRAASRSEALRSIARRLRAI